MPSLLVLDDDAMRASAFAAILPQLGADWTLNAWSDPAAMLAELDAFLPRAGFITLEAANAKPIVDHLASRNPGCPVLLHYGPKREAAWAFFKQLRATGWDAGLVARLSDAVVDWWYPGYWLDEAHRLLCWRTDTRANGVHAANCERLRQFEGREAIYVEKYVRRIRVSHFRAHIDARYAEAWAEEILTPGLGAPGELWRRRWRFGGGDESRFSLDSWSNSAQHVSWHLFSAPEAIDAIVRFADRLPPEEVFHSLPLSKLVSLELGWQPMREEKPVFP